MMKARLVLALLSICTGAAQAQPTDGKLFELQLLTFNDYHGHLLPPAGNDATLGLQLDADGNLVGGAEYLATTLAQLRHGHPHSLTATAGDLIGGSPFLSAAFHDEPSVETLNALGLDVSSVGNHEFDEGRDELLRMQYGGCHPVDGCYFPDEPYEGAKFPWLAANVVDTATGETLLPGTWIKNVGGVRIGFIGMTLEGTNLLVAQTGIQGLAFRDEVESANEAASRLQQEGVRTIIVLIHEGGIQGGTFQDCQGISGPIVDIVSNLDPEIDLVVTGHTHQPYVCSLPDPLGQPRLVTSAASFGRVVTETILVLDRQTGQVRRDLSQATNHLVLRTVPRNSVQTGILEKWQVLAGPFQRRVVGTITEDITGSASGNRGAESALANLLCDTLLEATDDPEEGGAEIALINIGAVRADLDYEQISGGEQPGEVTYSEAFAVQPFGNLNTVMDLTGEQIQRLLEQQFRADRSRQQLFFGISEGFSFTWVSSAPEGSKVPDASVTLNGQPLDPDATYRVTVNNFLAAGGDGFDVFLEGTNRQGGGGDLEAFFAYFAAHGPVSSPGTDRILELAAPIQAGALPPLTVCTGTDTTTYSPGLRLFSRTIDTAWTDDYPVCVSTTSGIVSASSPGGAYTAPLSCLDLLTSDPTGGSQRIDWSNGGYSIFSWDDEDTVIVSAAGQSTVTVNATVTEGLFLGQPLVEVIVLPEPGLAGCLLEPGITKTTGTITLMVLPL